MHPFISQELANARHQDDLRRAERSRLAREARRERKAARRQQPTLRQRLTIARRAPQAPEPTPESELFTPPTPLRARAGATASPQQDSQQVDHRRSA